MKQPKFKFGDKVCYKESPLSCFIVQKMAYEESGKNGFYYGCNDGYPESHEETLDTYQESKKKKLYAYRNECGMIQFSESCFDRVRDRANDEVLSYAPEYDIEYPEVNHEQ